jgi:hypothetical protein
MKLPINPAIPNASTELIRLLRDIAQQLNGITEGRISQHHAALTAAPTTGSWAQGDFVRNSTPAESGTGGMKYIIYGWECVTAGTPGTWVEVRTLTGGGVDITKLLTATATLNFGSIAANGSEVLTITVTGAAIGDTVLLAPPSTLESGLVSFSFVSAADTVSVRLHNGSGGTLDPASATWRATVMAFA